MNKKLDLKKFTTEIGKTSKNKDGVSGVDKKQALRIFNSIPKNIRIAVLPVIFLIGLGMFQFIQILILLIEGIASWI